MEAVILLGVGLLVCGWAFNAGKREGSRKAFHAGREHSKRLWKRWTRRGLNLAPDCPVTAMAQARASPPRLRAGGRARASAPPFSYQRVSPLASLCPPARDGTGRRRTRDATAPRA